jgi:anti-sigma factor RsiW
MKCEDARRYAGPYLDSELDPKTSFEVARHLEACAACRARFEAEAALERGLAKELERREPGDEALWARALHRAESRRTSRWRRIAAASGGLAAAAVLVAILALGGDGLAADLRKDHLKHERGGASLEISSGNASEVEAFFKDRMGLSVPVPAPAPAGWELVGGRKCALRGVPTAFLLYRLAGRDVTAYVFLGDHLDRFKDAGTLSEPLMDESAEIRVAVLRSGPHVIGAAGAVHCHHLLELCRAFGDRSPR